MKAREFASKFPEHRQDVDVFLEELIVRREFAVNFVLHNPSYDSSVAPHLVPHLTTLTLPRSDPCPCLTGRELAAGPELSSSSSADSCPRDHAHEKRTHTYTEEQLEQGRTHDQYWNAAQVGWDAAGSLLEC